MSIHIMECKYSIIGNVLLYNIDFGLVFGLVYVEPRDKVLQQDFTNLYDNINFIVYRVKTLVVLLSESAMAFLIR